MSQPAEARIVEAVRAQERDTLAWLASLVRIPSLTGEEGEGQKWVGERLAELGLEVEQWEPDTPALLGRYPEIAQYPSHWQHDLVLPYTTLPTWPQLLASGLEPVLNYRGRPNVVGRRRGLDGGRSLILNAHIDVVTVEPRQDWRHDPFGAVVEDGRLYGRGAADMKGGLVAGLAALRALGTAGVRLRGDVVFESVVNEEHAGNGTLECVRRGITADAAMVLEPSSGVVGVTTHGGLYWGVTVPGRQVGTAARWRGEQQWGVSAIEKLGPVIEALLSLEAAQNRTPAHPLDGGKRPFSLTLGRVQGGSYDTATAASCLLKGGVYFSPAIGSVQRVMQLLREAVAEAAARDPWLAEHRPEVHFYHHDDASAVPVDAPIAGIVAAAVAAATGATPPVRSFGGACDMRHLVNQAAIPTVVYGPGSMEQAHMPDESIQLSDMAPAVEAIALAVYRWCGAAA